MTTKYFSGREGHYVFCDICGQPCYIWETKKLSTYTGRGGLVVCKEDADEIDYGLMPYEVSHERSPDVTRVNHQNTDNGTEPEDIESSTNLGV